jgi:AraC family transcriptional regulator, ethanolamine operon transcriptional activator
MAPAPMSPASAVRRDHLLQDPQEHAGLFAGWEQRYDQISHGPFRSHLVEIEFADIHIFEETLGQAVFQTGSCPREVVALGVFSDISGNARLHGRSVGLDDVLFLDGCSEFLLSTPQISTLLAIGIPVATLEPWFEHAPLPLRESAHRMAAAPMRDRSAAQRLREGLSSIIGKLTLHPEEYLPGGRMKQLRDELVMLVVGLLRTESDPHETTALAKAKAVVQRSRAYALERHDHPPTLPELCHHTHVSPRTLQYCFQAVLGESPASYIKMLRLNGSRHDLKRLDENVLIGDIAANWGFWHLSQFASDYRRMFGELPSATRTAR